MLQSTTQVNIDGGDPTAPATPGDVLNLDLTGEPGPIIIDTVSGRIITGNGQASFSATNIETFNVTHDYGDVELEDGDLFVGGTDANDRIILSGSSEVDVRIGSIYSRDSAPTGRVVVLGGGGDDQIIANGRWTRDVYFDGGDGNDYLVAGGGDDELYGGAGNDRLYGGDGNDLIFGGAGNDTIDTGNGTRDEAHGEDGNDTILGGDGDDLLTGGAGNDSINGRYGNDLIFGGTGNDSLQGYHGDDIVVGGDGDDIVQGGDGDDIVVGGNSRDTVRGNGGNDVVAGGTSSVDAVKGPISPATRTALENALAAWIANGMAADLSFFSFADDGVEDQLYGDAGDDWFFSASPDRIRSV